MTSVSALPLNTTDMLEEINVTAVKAILLDAKQLSHQISRIRLEDAKVRIRRSQAKRNISWWDKIPWPTFIPHLTLTTLALALAMIHLLWSVCARIRGGPSIRRGILVPSTNGPYQEIPLRIAPKDE